MDGNTGTLTGGNLKNGGPESRIAGLKNRLDQLLHEAANLEVELSRAEGAIQGVPHYSVIEGRAHELGRQLSRQVQQQQMNELAAAREQTAACPTCKASCSLAGAKRFVKSVDGDVELQELVEYSRSSD